MSDTEEPQDAPAGKKSRLPLVLGLALMLASGGGSFYAIYSGLILKPGSEDAHAVAEPGPLPDIAYVPIESMIISIGGDSRRYLHFTAQLEVAKPHAEEVTHVLPRVLDVLNSYLRAVDVTLLEDRLALIRLRAQMLRRVQIVTGEGRVRDLLVTEFVIN